jgi:hydroxymethylpyrimidine/phosphomethylpyrimidine kinase
VAANTPNRTALTIASSDSGGGAGIQADLKSFARCGVHGTSVIVALTAQNTVGVSAILQCPPEFITAQLAAVFDDLPPGAVKTGMLFSVPIIETVAQLLADRGVQAGRGVPLVIDPVMIASSGARLLREDAVQALTGLLFPLATVITPNLMEAQALTGLQTESRAELAEALVAMGAAAALVTGGHGSEPVDHLLADGHHHEIAVVREPVAATHGAGCTHSAALAACLARGDSLLDAARRASAVAGRAVRHGWAGLGAGDGPVDALDVRSFTPPGLPAAG